MSKFKVGDRVEVRMFFRHEPTIFGVITEVMEYEQFPYWVDFDKAYAFGPCGLRDGDSFDKDQLILIKPKELKVFTDGGKEYV